MSEQPENIRTNRIVLLWRILAVVGILLAIAPALLLPLRQIVEYQPVDAYMHQYVRPYAMIPLLCAVASVLFSSVMLTITRDSAAVIIARIGFWGGIVAVVLTFQASAGHHAYARENHCLQTQREIAIEIQFYTNEHDDQLPEATNFWNMEVVRVNQPHCMYSKSYIANGPICGKALAAIPDPAHTFLTADGESKGDKAPNIGRYYEDFDAGRHHYRGTDYVIASFVDGHVDIAVPVADDPHWLPRKETP